MLTALRKLAGHWLIGPIGVDDQSKERIRVPISPPLARQHDQSRSRGRMGWFTIPPSERQTFAQEMLARDIETSSDFAAWAITVASTWRIEVWMAL
jgi:hypothetical protein